MKMLIVDDREENLYMLESLLKGKGYEVASAMNGVEALERLKEDSFDMIISDILMPKMDGFQLCRECKGDDTLKKIPFVFYTASYSDKKDEEFGLSLGAERYITKPIEPERFIEIIEDIVKDYEKDLLAPPEVPVEKEEAVYLKEYSERLVDKLESKVVELDEVNKALEQRTYDMGERIKELHCMYGVATSIRKRETMEEVFRDVVGLIPPAWQYPEITRARLRFDEIEYLSEPFEETEWKQSSDIIVNGERRGAVEVYYLESHPERDEGPFLKEERQLLDGIATTLGEAIEHRRTEEKIERAAEEWRTTFDSISDFVSIHGKDYKVVRVNRAFADAVKMKPGELIGKLCYELVHGTKEPHPDCPFKQVQKTKKPSTVEYFEPSLGMHVQASISPIINEEGEFAGTVHIIKDITARKQAEEALRESQEFAKNIIDSSLDMIVAVDNERRITEFNHAAEDAFGYHREEVLGKNANLLYAEPKEGLAIHKQTIMSGHHVREILNRHRNGKTFPGLLSSSVLRDSSGEVVGVMGVSRDVTERKLAEETLQKAHDELEQRVEERTADLAIANEQLEKAKEVAEVATRAKSDFLANMSHELRTPLNAIIGFSEILSDQTFGELNQKQLKYTNHVLTSGHHLLALINDILDLSKVEAGKMELERSTVAIKSLLEDSLVMIKEKAYKHGISLDLRIPDELSDLKFQADERKLKQIMFNLLSNAVKFTPDGGTITVESKQKKGESIVAVSDTGIGIKHEDLERVFGEFEQIDSTHARQQQGTGLGLALTRRLVELHGGRIRAESEGEGKGSTFTFVIPIETE